MSWQRPKPGTSVTDMPLARDEFGRRFRAARERAHLTQQDVADALGQDWRQIQRYDAGKVVPRANRIPELAKVLGVDPSWLMEPQDEHVLERIERKAEEAATLSRTALGLLDELLTAIRDHDSRITGLIDDRSAGINGRIEALEARQDAHETQFSQVQQEILRIAGVTLPPPSETERGSTRTPRSKTNPDTPTATG